MIICFWVTCEWYVVPELRAKFYCVSAMCYWYVESELRANDVFELRANFEFRLSYVRMICCVWAERKCWLFFSYVLMICWVWAACKWCIWAVCKLWVISELRANDMLCLSYVQTLSCFWATCKSYVVFELRANDKLCLSYMPMHTKYARKFSSTDI